MTRLVGHYSRGMKYDPLRTKTFTEVNIAVHKKNRRDRMIERRTEGVTRLLGSNEDRAIMRKYLKKHPDTFYMSDTDDEAPVVSFPFFCKIRNPPAL